MTADTGTREDGMMIAVQEMIEVTAGMGDGSVMRKRDAGGIIAMNIGAAFISGCKRLFCNVSRRALSNGNKQKEGTDNTTSVPSFVVGLKTTDSNQFLLPPSFGRLSSGLFWSRLLYC